MLLFLLNFFCFFCSSFGGPYFFNPLFSARNEGFFDAVELPLERSFADEMDGVNVPAFPYHRVIPRGVGSFSASLNPPFRGIRPSDSSNIPLYTDAGSVTLNSYFGGSRVASKSQAPPVVSNTKPKTTLAAPPLPRPRPLSSSYQPYRKPQTYPGSLKASATSLKSITYSADSQKVSQYAATSYSPSLQTGFTPIFNGKKNAFNVLKSPSHPLKKFPDLHVSSSTVQSNSQSQLKPFAGTVSTLKKFPDFHASSSTVQSNSQSQLKPFASTVSTLKKFPDFHASSSTVQSNSRSQLKALAGTASTLKRFPDLQASSSVVQSTSHSQLKPLASTLSTGFSALTAIPAVKLAQARKVNRPSLAPFGTRISSPLLNHTYIKTSVSSSISTSVESSQPDENLKSSASSPEATAAQAEEQLDLSCEGSRDLGWCDLGARYPKSIVHQLLNLCKDFVERTYLEIPHSFAELSGPYEFSSPADNASYREAKERGNHDSWSWASYFSKKGSLCDVEQGFVRPEAAKDTSGVWTVIVQTDDVRQRVPIEMCRKPNSACKKVSDCGLKSQCFQKYSYSHLLSLDPNQVQLCPSIKLYKFPSACVCHIE